MRIMVVEDEEIVARRLVRLVTKILGEQVESLQRAASLAGALEHVREHPIDLLFLDLNLEGQDGFLLLAEAVAGSFQTIVVSAQHDQALRAFEYGVTDFVAKPYDEDRLRLAISRVSEPDPARQPLKVLAVREAGEVKLVAIESILYIKGADDYSEIHRDDGSTLLHAKTLRGLNGRLPAFFERVHRSYVVNAERIETYRTRPGSRYSAVLDNGEEIPVSRTRFRELAARWS